MPVVLTLIVICMHWLHCYRYVQCRLNISVDLIIFFFLFKANGNGMMFTLSFCVYILIF